MIESTWIVMACPGIAVTVRLKITATATVSGPAAGRPAGNNSRTATTVTLATDNPITTKNALRFFCLLINIICPKYKVVH